MKENLKWIFDIKPGAYKIVLTIMAFLAIGLIQPSLVIDTYTKAIVFFIAWILISMFTDIALRSLAVLSIEIKDLLKKKRG